MLEDDAEPCFAARGGLHRGRARLGVLRDILVQLLEIGEGLILAHDLHEGGKRGIGRARGIRIGNLDLALQRRVEQILPALRRRDALLREYVLVVAPAERPGIDADRVVAGHFGLLHRPVPQLVEHGRLVLRGQSVGGGLKVRVAGTCPPQVGLRVARLGADLGIGLARRQPDHVHADIGVGLLEFLDKPLADDDIGRADEVQFGRQGSRRNECGSAREGDHQSLHAFLPTCSGWSDALHTCASG